jgi:hypothetical protein
VSAHHVRLRRDNSRVSSHPRASVIRATARRRVAPVLRVGDADDPAEHEADRIAARVIADLAGRPADPCSVPASRAPSRIRRSTTTIGHRGGAVDPGVQSRIEAARGAGAPLPDDVQRAMSIGFGTSFERVRVHADGTADELNRRLGSRAFTIGHDVFFAEDEFNPDRPSGQRLLAHELAHTVQQAGGSETAGRTIRRWDVAGNNIDVADTVAIRTISSGQAIFFVEDNTGDTMVVKGDNVPVGMNQLFAMIHHQVSGTSSILVRQLPDAQRPGLKAKIADPNVSADATWANLYAARPATIDHVVAVANAANVAYVGGNAPADSAGKARLFHIEQLDAQAKVVAMTDASAGDGQAVEGSMRPGAGGGPGGGPKTARAMFGDPVHMRMLGVLTATDLFLGNTDRVHAGNFGNWFVDPTGAITLIDNLDTQAKAELQQGEVAGSSVAMLAKGAIRQTAAHCIATLIRGMKQQGDATTDDWANTLVKGRARRAVIEDAFLDGLKAGKARIVKVYATGKTGAVGRGAKAAAQATQHQDTVRGDATATAYWDTIKRRARWLASH